MTTRLRFDMLRKPGEFFLVWDWEFQLVLRWLWLAFRSVQRRVHSGFGRITQWHKVRFGAFAPACSPCVPSPIWDTASSGAPHTQSLA